MVYQISVYTTIQANSLTEAREALKDALSGLYKKEPRIEDFTLGDDEKRFDDAECLWVDADLED